MSYYPNVYASQTGPLVLSGLDANFNFAVDIQSQSLYAAAGGASDIITATFTPTVTALVSGLTLYVRAATANTTTTPTFSPNSLTAHTIVKFNNQALAVGDIAGAGHILILQYDTTNSVWELVNPATANTSFPGGTANGVLYLNGSKVATSGTALVFDGTNLGVGVTPSSWYTTSKAIELGNYAAISGSATTGYANISNNAYQSSGSNWAYKITDKAALYSQTNGAHAWYYAASGTAGNSITWTQAMTLDTNGNLGLGATPTTGWAGSGWTSLDLAYATTLASNNAGTAGFGNNWYNNGTNYLYKSNGYAGMYLSSSATSSIHRWYVAASGTTGGTISFTTAMTLDSSGNLTVPAMYGTTVTTPRNVFIDSTGKMGGISSIRASKINIENLLDANWLTALTPVTFNYRKRDVEGNYTDEFENELQYGLIAEDVEAIKPEFCIYVDGKLAGIHYDRMISPLIKIIQNLETRLAALEAK